MKKNLHTVKHNSGECTSCLNELLRLYELVIKNFTTFSKPKSYLGYTNMFLKSLIYLRKDKVTLI